MSSREAAAVADVAGIRTAWSGAIVDADVHAVIPSLDALVPYLSAQWTEFLRERAFVEPWGLPVTYPPNTPTAVAPAWRRADGRPAATSLEILRRDLLDPLDVELAVVTCTYGVDSVRHPDLAAALASAVNDWLRTEWLEPEPRLRGTIVVPARHPQQMIAEIDRVAASPGFVQVLLPVRSDRPYGNRIWHPVLDRIAGHGLVAGLHWGGSSDGPPSPVGWPSWYVEEYAAEQQVYMAQLTSLIGEGVFQVVPGLRVAVGEIGFAWLPSLVWRLTKEWKGLRRDVPWVNRPPSDLIREHLRFTTAPLDAGSPEDMRDIVEWLGSEDLLMFATDYPHAHELDLGAFLDVLPESMRPRTMAGTARDLYGRR